MLFLFFILTKFNKKLTIFTNIELSFAYFLFNCKKFNFLLINKYSNKKLDVFIEINIDEEESKYGIKSNLLFDFYKELIQFEKINVIGLMCICKNSNNEVELDNSFKKMNLLLQELNNKFNTNFKELSMGMSGDYQLAIQNNATYIRIGSMLMGD